MNDPVWFVAQADMHLRNWLPQPALVPLKKSVGVPTLRPAYAAIVLFAVAAVSAVIGDVVFGKLADLAMGTP